MEKKGSKNKKLKKGLSTIVITLIIILVSLVAVGIVWVVVRNVINSGTRGVGIGQFMLNAQIMNVYADNNSNNVSLTVKRNAGPGEITGIKFVFYDGINYEGITEAVSLDELDEKRFTFHLNKTEVSNLISVSIAPIFTGNSGKENLGNVLSEYNFKTGIITSNPTSEEPQEPGETCNPETCASLGYECGTPSNGTCSGTLNCNTPGCGTQSICSLGTCVCNSGYADCNNDNSCECALSSNSCVGGSCIANPTINICNNLFLLMHFDNQSSVGENSTFVYDWSRTGNNGRAYVNDSLGNTGWTPYGKFGGSFWFDGKDDTILIPKTQSLATNLSNGTISAWVYLNGTDTSMGIIGTYGYQTATTWCFGKYYSTWNFFFGWNVTGGGVKTMLYNNDSLPMNLWTHYAISWNSTGLYGYLNGVLKDKNFYKDEFPYFKMYYGTSAIAIGSLSPGYNIGPWVFNGTVDDIAMWNRSLNADEISQVYNSGTAINC